MCFRIGTQAGYQLAGLALTIGMSVVSGRVTGLLLRIPLIQQITDEEEYFEDAPFWELPETAEKSS